MQLVRTSLQSTRLPTHLPRPPPLTIPYSHQLAHVRFDRAVPANLVRIRRRHRGEQLRVQRSFSHQQLPKL